MTSIHFQRVEEGAAIDLLAGELSSILASASSSINKRALDLSIDLLKKSDHALFARHAELLMRACFGFFEVGQSSQGIALGERIAIKAEELGNIQIQRRVCNIVGGQYGDIADFPSAMQKLEVAVALARKIGDPIGEAACLANVIAVLQEMGHYRQAINMAERVLRLREDTQNAQTLKLQCASNGLFAAHRIGDADWAARFLAEGQRYLTSNTVPLRRAFFERSRALYLVDLGQAPRARRYLAETIAALTGFPSPRIDTLLAITAAVCDWAVGERAKARADLQTLYRETKRSRLYHHFVLQALIKCFSDSSTPEEATAGMAYARELVEYTTSVKKAKFYKQLASKRESSEQKNGAMLSHSSIDPFDSARDWLNTSDIKAPPEEDGERRELAKHEELTAIHEDMAKLRAASIRRDIRTDAVDTAENWAIAAEFFDDETGQHCYRVGHLAGMLAREIGMQDTFCVQIEHAARLHDIGKIAVNEVILLKPGPLDASEMAAMRLHTEVGAQILAGSDDPTLKMACEVARHHHEWWNGAGYPVKLGGKDIPLSARVCAYADVYDALTHMRAYKKAWTHERALEEIIRLGGTQFDPNLLDPFVAVLERYRAVLAAGAIPGFVDMNSNALIASRKRLMETIAGAT